ncbi:hypothetical protein FJZ31_22215 [Candidatus Poribacteria bacterium]|nr:hypothetical protein [Candidatus Poribacteria bacterium]
MNEVQAWQHIYTNVEKEQSPRRIAGFQTLFYTTSALTEAEVEEMEARLLYFPSESEPVKRVFFTTSTGKCVVGQIVPLPDPDRLGRKGRYLAHSLVFALDQFIRLRANPFYVFRRFPFITTVEEALKQGNFETGDIPDVSVKSPRPLASPLCSLRSPTTSSYGGDRREVLIKGEELPEDSEREIEVVAPWPRQELKKLTLLALRAQQLSRERSTVAFVGEPQQVEAALEVALFGVPSSIRQHCAFDTYFYKCNPVATYYWGVGLLESPRNPNFIVVDTRSRRVLREITIVPENTYERWALTALEADDLNAIAHYRDDAFALSQWLDGHAYEESLVASAPPQIVTSIFRVSSEQVKSRLLERLSGLLPSALAQRILEHIYRQTSSYELFRQLREGFQMPQLLDVLNAVYVAQNYRSPQRKEVEALGTLLQQADHPTLRLLHVCWTGQHTQLRHKLERLNEEEYRQFVQNALRFGLMEPLSLLLPGKGEEFVDWYITLIPAQTRDWVSFVKTLLGMGEVNCLGRLVPHVSGWSARELQIVERLLRRRTDAPESFQHALREALTAIPNPRGIKDFLKSLRGLLPGQRLGKKSDDREKMDRK